MTHYSMRIYKDIVPDEKTMPWDRHPRIDPSIEDAKKAAKTELPGHDCF